MKKVLVGALVLISVLVLFTGTALAAVSFNPSTGTGFVGKGDVQTAFGWNNAQLQKNLSNVRFYYQSYQEYTVSEEWSTLAGGSKNTFVNTHTITKTTVCSVNGVVAYDARVRNQITGIYLTGYQGVPVVVGGVIPVIGDIVVDRQNDRNANGNWFEGVEYPTDTIVTTVDLTADMGGLYAVYGGISVRIG